MIGESDYGALHKVRHAIFLANFYPLSSCHTLSRIPGPPKKVRHTSQTPLIFLVGLVAKIQTKASCTNSLSIVRGVFVRGFVRGSFLWKVLSVVVFAHSFFCHNTYVTGES